MVYVKPMKTRSYQNYQSGSRPAGWIGQLKFMALGTASDPLTYTQFHELACTGPGCRSSASGETTLSLQKIALISG